MRLEHFALQLPDPVAAADWYTTHLGCTVVRRLTAEPWTHFLAAPGGAVLLELYRNPAAPLPDYAGMHPLLVHLAFEVDDVAAERDRLLAAGATLATDLDVTPAGDTLCMLRDPWGLAVQLIRRAEAMLAG